MDDLSGQNLKGYEVLEHIAAGGFGAVYRAHQPAVDREVAIKVILPQYANQPNFIRRFEVEAQLIARLEHPFIVPLYDYWREPSGAYLVMRWLRGGSLRDLLQTGPLNLQTTVAILDQITSALAVAHRHNVVHRDLKPANILLDEEGNAYLADFGIAKDLGGDGSRTQEGAVVGSPAYISPEQVKGELVSPQTDIYCLGVVIYELLTGEHPFPGETPSSLTLKHLSNPLPSPCLLRPELPIQLNSVIQTATAKEPGDRYPDVLSLAIALHAALGQPAPATGPAVVVTGAARGSEVVPTWIEEPEIVRNPYKGLQAFAEADAADFFGREALVEQLLARLEDTGEFSRFLAVVGPSGCGKSSVIKAGLVPALRDNRLPDSEKWYIVPMLPGAHPLEEVDIALTRVATNPALNLVPMMREDKRGLLRAVRKVLPEGATLLLVIDQFEEIFTLVEDPASTDYFMESLCIALTDPKSPLRVIVTLRADFYDRPLMHCDFSQLMRYRTEVVAPLTPDEVEKAIAGPAECVGLTVEPGLLSAMVAEVHNQPGALPLLQYALTELFDLRQDHSLTMSAYQTIGGTLGALARRADEVYESLDTSGKEAARQMFLRLVTLGEGTEDTRRRVLQTELLALGAPEVMQQAIRAFGRIRLLTFDRDPVTRSPTVELAHEAILREWGQMRDWLDESRGDVRLQRLLAAAAREWTRAKRDPGFLLSGSRLAQYQEWALGSRVVLAEEEQVFLDASIAESERKETIERERQARERSLERRSRNVLRVLVAVLLLATVGAVLFSLFAVDREGRAQTARTEAQSLFWASSAQQLAGSGNTVLAIPLALLSTRIEQPPFLAQRVLAQVAYAPGARHLFGSDGTGHTEAVQGVAFSPDGQKALSAASDDTLILWDVATGDMLRTFRGHTDDVWSVAFSPDGQTAISASMDQSLILWDVETGQTLRTFSGHAGPVHRVAFSPDGQRVLSGSDDTTLILWDVATGEALRTFEGHEDYVDSVAFSPDGETALSTSGDGTVILWDVATGEAIRVFEGHEDAVICVAFSPDGQTALSGSDDTTLIWWDVETGEALRTFEGHTEWVSSVAFSPDGQTAISASGDGSLILWDIETGEAIRTFWGHTDYVNSVAFSPDGRTVLSGSEDQSVILWDIERGDMLRVFQAGTVSMSVAFSPDGATALSGTVDGPLVLWDVGTGEALRTFEGHSDVVTSVAFSPDGLTALSGSGDTTLILWDVQTGEAVRTFEGHSELINGIAFSPDGRTALSGSDDTTVILWDVQQGQALRVFEGHTQAVNCVAFRPDGQTAVSGSRDRTLILWDLETGEPLRVFEGHTAGVNNLAMSPDGRTMLSASWDTTLILWDLETGEALHTLRGHTAPVNGVAISPKGDIAVSDSGDGTLIMWDLAAGEQLHTFEGHTDWVNSVAFSPDGQTVLSDADDETLILWRVDTLEELADWTYSNRYVRDFTCEEREMYRIEPLCNEGD